MFVTAKNINQFFPSLVVYTKQLVDSNSSYIENIMLFFPPLYHIGSWRNCRYKEESMLATGLRYFSMFGIDVLFIIQCVTFTFYLFPIKYHCTKSLYIVHVPEINTSQKRGLKYWVYYTKYCSTHIHTKRTNIPNPNQVLNAQTMELLCIESFRFS